MGALKAEWTAAGREEEFHDLRPFLDGNSSRGELSELAARTGLTENTLRSQLHRMRRAFRKHRRAGGAPTLSSDQDTSGELRTLIDSLRPT